MKRLAIAAIAAVTLTATLQAQTLEERVTALENRMNSLENRVSRLETFHPEIRTFTILQGNFTFEEFNDYISRLDVKDGDWVYIRAKGEMRGDGSINTTEMCTSDPRYLELFTKYLDPNLDPMQSHYFDVDVANQLTYLKSDFGPEWENWRPATRIKGDVRNFDRIQFKAYGNYGYFTMTVNSRMSDIFFNINVSGNEAFFKAASTRQEACGF